MYVPSPVQILQPPGYVVMLFERMSWRIIPLDGRAHIPDNVRLWQGDSVGRWDGDTLVVDTTGFNGKTRLDTLGHPHSDQLHLIQRLTLTDPEHMNYVITIDDPKTYTKPWSNTRVFTKMKPGEELMEYSCEENNRDFTEGHIK
jgi:hypothetical protein